MTPTQTSSELLADAHHVLERARAHLPLFSKKRMDKRFFTRFERKLKDAERVLSASPPAPLSAADKARRALYEDALARLTRDAARARLSEVPSEGALADPATRSAANRAGITSARLRAVGMLRVSLGDPAQPREDPAPILAAVAEQTARVREVAAVVLKKSPDKLAEFAPPSKNRRGRRSGGGSPARHAGVPSSP